MLNRYMLRLPATMFVMAMSLFCSQTIAGETTHDPGRTYYAAQRAEITPLIDGVGNDPAWEKALWRPIDNVWLGEDLAKDDFSGRYKLTWTRNKLYILVEFVDDVLVDFHRHPLKRYWDDDCLELFIDEDHSGGNHQYNHNAFAYHLSLDNQAIDIGTDKKARSYTHHVQSQWRQHEGVVQWEVAVDIYSDAYRDDGIENKPVELTSGKVMGFMVAYCDNDHSELREHFIGSEDAGAEHKDRGWIDAGMFGTLELVD